MIYRSYKDLCKEIELVEAGIRQYERNKEALQRRGNIDGPGEVKGIDYSKPSVDDSSTMDFGTYLIHLRQIDSHLFLHREQLKILNRDKEEREKKLSSMEGLSYKVAYLREIEGKTLKEISEELDYSYQYIKEVSSKAYF